MTSMLLEKEETGSLKLSHLKSYRNALKLVYNNPEFKAAYRHESNDTVFKMLSYIEIMRKRSEEVLTKNCENMMAHSPSNIDEAIVKDITKQFINDNIGSVRKLSLLPAELQPSRESIETITKISLSMHE